MCLLEEILRGTLHRDKVAVRETQCGVSQLAHLGAAQGVAQLCFVIRLCFGSLVLGYLGENTGDVRPCAGEV